MARTPLRPDDPTRIGHYRLTARLGSGGMGVVYLGVSWDGSPVAVKVLRPELADDQEFRQRFGREVAALVRVRSKRTVRVIEADSQSSTPFVVTEYAEGPSLAEQIGKRGPVSTDVLYGLAAGLAEALTVIHAAGLMHRDLKPANIILTDAGPKVIDFGIARGQNTKAMTKAGMIVGSMGFMAPEQIKGHPDQAADVFAWGVTVGYAGTGRPPFGTGNAHAILYRVMYGDPDVAGTPDSVRPMVEAALAKDPRSRPTARQLLDRLTGVSAGLDFNSEAPTQVISPRPWPTGRPPGPLPDRSHDARPSRRPAPTASAPAAAAPAAAAPAVPTPAAPAPAAPTPAAAAPAAAAPVAAAPATAGPAAPASAPLAAMPPVAAPPVAVPSAARSPGTPKVPVGRRLATMARSAVSALRRRSADHLDGTSSRLPRHRWDIRAVVLMRDGV